MKSYVFTVGLVGKGDNEQQAWEDAIESFQLDPGSIPEYEIDEDEIYTTSGG